MDAAIVVAGGLSTRMGRPKAWLDWRGRPLLLHVVDVAAAAVDGPVIVVAPDERDLPPLPDDVDRVADVDVGRGPLCGLATGLQAAGERGADRAVAVALDLPLMTPEFLRRVLALLDSSESPPWEVVLPTIDGHHQPLAAAYRTALAARAAEMLTADHGGLKGLLQQCRVRAVGPEELLADPDVAAADPQLRSTFNVNDDAAYQRALDLARP